MSGFGSSIRIEAPRLLPACLIRRAGWLYLCTSWGSLELAEGAPRGRVSGGDADPAHVVLGGSGLGVGVEDDVADVVVALGQRFDDRGLAGGSDAGEHVGADAE